MNKIFYSLVLICALQVPSWGQTPSPEKELHFTPAEVESMLFLYNQTTVKGSDVELVAPVGAKLKAGLKEARALKDTTKSITLKLNLTQLQICLNIINNSTFEAKYAELVLGMKRKLKKLLPPKLQAGDKAVAAGDTVQFDLKREGSSTKKGGEP